MKRTQRSVLSMLLSALALAAAVLSLSTLPEASCSEPSAKEPVQLVQSTSAILEDKAA